MKVSELWAVCWTGALFSVRPLWELMELNRRVVMGNGPGGLLLDVRGSVVEANARRLELEKERFGHALCGRRANESMPHGDKPCGGDAGGDKPRGGDGGEG